MKVYMEDIMKYVKKHKEIIIYGAGQVATGLSNDLRASNIYAKCFVVSKIMGQSTEINGIPVKSIDDINVNENMGIIIGVSIGKVKGIVKELEKREISDYFILEQKYIDSILKSFTKPKMEITTVIGCAVNCYYCPQKLLVNEYCSKSNMNARVMSFETFKYCLDRIPLDVQIYFVGMAEPFQNEKCMDMIRYAITNGYQVGLYTTCVGLNKINCEELITMPIKEVILHVPDEENYAHINLSEEYWEVVSLLLNAKRYNGKNFVDSCSCQGTPLKKFLKINDGNIRIETYLHDRAGNLNDKTGKLETSGYVRGKIYCSHSGTRLDHNILLPDGTVLLCCMDYGMKHILGNLTEKTYNEIIKGEEMKKIRYALEDEDQILLCRNCTYAIRCNE